jgi:capsular exopolysaccharide synthesis family protein
MATAVGLVLGGTAAAIVYMTFQPVYEAEAWIRIRESQPAVLFNDGTGRSDKFVETQRELLRSPKVLRRALSDPAIAAIPDVASQDSAVTWLREKLNINTIGRSELFRVALEMSQPEHAVALVDGVVNSYDKVRREADAGQRYQWVEFLDTQKGRREEEVKQLREKVRALAKAAGVDPLSVSEKESSQPHPLSEVRSRLAMAQVEQEVLQARIKAFEQGQDDPAAALSAAVVARSVAEHPQVLAMQSRILEKRQYLQEIRNRVVDPSRDSSALRLAQEITRDEVALKQLREQLQTSVREELQAKQSAERASELSGMRQELASLEMLEEALRERYELDKEEVKEATGDTVELDFARMELAEKQEVLNLLNRRIIEYRTEDTAPQRVTVVDTAEENFPTAPVQQYPLKMLGLAMLVGFCAPFGLAIGWERLVGRISDADSMERQTHLAVLGEIANLPTRSVRGRRVSDSRVSSAFRLFEESIDNVRTGLVLADELEGTQVLAVTSATKAEGKTSFAAQLAVSLARASGKPTLLIDGDLRSPDVHRVFSRRQTPGLAEVLAGESTLEETIVETRVAGLRILPAGEAKISPQRLMNNGELKELIAQARAPFAYIVLDTPPVLAAAESLVLNKAADAVVLCAMRDLTRGTQVRHACDRLSAAGCQTVGSVLNGIPTHRFRYAYGQYVYAK